MSNIIYIYIYIQYNINCGRTQISLSYQSQEFIACEKLLSFESRRGESVPAVFNNTDNKDLRAFLVAKGYSNAKTRELSKALAAIWQPVSLPATIAKFHLCPLKRQNLSAVALQRHNFAGHHFCPVSCLFSIVILHLSLHTIFPVCRVYPRSFDRRHYVANPDSLAKSRITKLRNCFGMRAGFNQTRPRFIAKGEK